MDAINDRISRPSRAPAKYLNAKRIVARANTQLSTKVKNTSLGDTDENVSESPQSGQYIDFGDHSETRYKYVDSHNQGAMSARRSSQPISETPSTYTIAFKNFDKKDIELTKRHWF